MKKLKNKKYIALTILAITFVFAFVGQIQNIHASSMKIVDGITYGLPEDYTLIFQEDDPTKSFEMNGLKYTVTNYSSQFLKATSSDNASEIETIFIYNYLDFASVNYYEIDFSDYTSLKNIYMMCPGGTEFYEKLSALSTLENLYHVGTLKFTDNLAACSFENIYYISSYENEETFTVDSSTLKNCLSNSNIKNIYYTDNNALWIEDDIEIFETENIINKNSEQIIFSIVEEASLEFSREQLLMKSNSLNNFYPDALGVVGNPTWDVTYELGDILADLEYNVVSSDGSEKVTSLVTYANLNHTNLPNDTYDVLTCMYGLPIYFTAYTIEELIVGNGQTNANFTHLTSAVKNIRFYYNENIQGNDEYEGVFAGETIYIPNEYKSHFTDIINNSSNSSKIVYYNQNEYELPNSAFLSEDGNKYEVIDQSLSIEYLESKIIEMTEANYDFDNAIPIDETITQYEETLDDTTSPLPDDEDGSTDLDDEILVGDEQTFLDYLTENLKENRALQITLIVSGTLLGIALLYISYKGIKKASKWLKG